MKSPNPATMRVFRLLSMEPHYKRNYVKNYYPRHVETGHLMRNLRDYGLYRDEHVDFHVEMIRLRALRGKVKKRGGEGHKPKADTVPSTTTSSQEKK